jgi:hypothetical protein
MTTAIQQTPGLDSDALLKLVTGDTSKLSPDQKVQLVRGVCEATGLDYRLSPFEFIKFQGKEIMYARKNAADQLVRVHSIKVTITDQAVVNDIRVVTCAAETKDGRHTEDVGAVNIKGLAGDALANALMKAVTKAKRRTVLSICGLSMMDESELETLPGPVVYGVPPIIDAKVDDTKPLPPKANAGAMTIWNHLVNDCGGDKESAKARLDAAAHTHFGVEVLPTAKWTDEDCVKVNALLFPDIKF